MTAARRLAGPLVLATVLAVALLVGSGVLDAPHSAAAARAASIEREVRCPSCLDLSVAQSNAPSSVALRHQIAAEVARGEPTQRILDGIVARYGTDALLVPPAGGLTTVLWAVPVAIAAAAAVAGGSVVLRRRRAT